MKQYKPVAPFNDHGSGCKGHANALLDDTYETTESRNLLKQILDHYISKA